MQKNFLDEIPRSILLPTFFCQQRPMKLFATLLLAHAAITAPLALRSDTDLQGGVARAVPAPAAVRGLPVGLVRQGRAVAGRGPRRRQRVDRPRCVSRPAQPPVRVQPLHGGDVLPRARADRRGDGRRHRVRRNRAAAATRCSAQRSRGSGAGSTASSSITCRGSPRTRRRA